MKIQSIIFDLDGVLLDTTTGFVESLQYALEQLGFSPFTNEKLTQFIGPPIHDTFVNSFHCTNEQAIKGTSYFRDYYKTKALFKAVPYDGIFDLCKELKEDHYKLGVATYKREDYAISLLKHFGFDQYFDVMHGADNENRLTKADIINLCINELGNQRENTVLIGDTLHDFVGAQKSQIFFLPVTYGFGFKEKTIDCPCIGIASKPMDIRDILKR